MLSKALYYLCMEIVQLRRPFCPLCHATPAAGGWDAHPTPPWGRQLVIQLFYPSWNPVAGEGEICPPPVCRETANWETRQEPTQQLITALPRYSNDPGVQRKTLWSVPPWTLPLPRDGNPHSHHSMGSTSWTRARENNDTFIKNTMAFFPLDPTSYLLTGVKYYYAATPSGQVFLSAWDTNHVF